MLAYFLGAPAPTVEVSLVRQIVVIPPSLDGEVDLPSLSGVVSLRVPTKLKARRLYVTLEGKAELHAVDKWPAETETVFRNVIELPLGEEEIAAGNHVFAFKMAVPSTIAVFQRTTHGRVLYHVTGTLELPPKRDVSSSPNRVFIRAVPFHGDFPPTFEMVHEHISEDLGPMRVQVFSPHLAPASLVHLRVFIPYLPVPIILDSVRLSLTQSLTIDYADANRPRNPAPSKHPLLYINTSLDPPSTSEHKNFGLAVNPGEEWEQTAIFRVPDERNICGSYVAGSTTKIVVSHTLTVDLRYRKGTGSTSLKSCAMQFPVHIGHCEAMPASWTLPEYASNPPQTRIKHTAEVTLCLCEYSDAEVLKLYRDALKVGGERVREVPIPDEAVEEGIERPVKSPAVQL